MFMLYVLFTKNKLMDKFLTKSANVYFNEIIDYAGLFPPAKLSLTESLDNYCKYKNGNYAWMLRRFVCPVSLFPELETLHSKYKPGKPVIEISATIKSSDIIEEFQNNLSNDLSIWNAYSQHMGDFIKINSVEIKLPAELVLGRDAKKISSFIEFIYGKILQNISENVFVFFEGITDENPKENLKAVIEGIELHNLKQFNSGFKLRMGGISPESVPDVSLIAFCIRECLDKKIPLKFTAGLHHPFRDFSEHDYTRRNGFVNVFAAGIIAMRHNISNTGMEEILNDEKKDNFVFTDEFFSWKDWKINIEDIEFARKNLVLSFGSCSFEEPVDDLKSFNLI